MAMFKFNWKDSHVPESKCPYCDKLQDGAASPDGYTPEPGHYAVCINCASLLRFGENMELLPVLRDEINTLRNEEPEFLEKMELMQRAVRSLPRRPKK